jgi:hypothetical protein
MFIKLETSLTGFQFEAHYGEFFNWEDEEEAERLVSRGMATPLTESGAIMLSRSENKPIRVRKAERRKVEQMVANQGPSTLNKLAHIVPGARKL